MSLRPLLPLLVLAFALPASASTVEDATGGFVAYQFDGDTHHDAPDACDAADPAWSAPVDGSTDGILLAPDDASDVFVIDVPEDLRGKRMHVGLSEATEVESLELTVFVPGCTGTVLDLVNWPTPGPTPPAPAEGESQVPAEEILEPWYCDSTRRMFWVETYPHYEAAPSIHVAWTDGTSRDVPLAYTHGAAHAVYVTDHALGATLSGAWVNMPSEWTGRFNFVAGPCDAVHGGVVYGDAPESGIGFVEFTTTTAGPYVVQVTYEEQAGVAPMPIPAPVAVDPEPYMPFEPSDLVQDPTGTFGGLGHGDDHEHEADGSDGGIDPSQPRITPPSPLMAPRSCHMCISDLQELIRGASYRLDFLSVS